MTVLTTKVLRCAALALMFAGATAVAATPPAKRATKQRAVPARSAAQPARPAAAAPLPAEPLTAGQMDAAARVYLGPSACRGDVPLQVLADAGRPGHFTLRFRQHTYLLVPQETTTGAVRLEDRRAGIVWLQIPAKSMLLDARAGQRLADDCFHAEQRSHVAVAGPGLGIEVVAALRAPVPEPWPACDGFAGRYFDSARASMLLAPDASAPIDCSVVDDPAARP